MRHGSTLRAWRQRGIGLLEVALLTALVGIAFVTGVAAFKSHQQSSTATAQMTALTQADRYLAGFVAAHNRLPCPDSTHGGYEDCSGAVQKGWLPYRTLGLEGSMAAAGVGLIAYEVQRSGVDLAAAITSNNSFEPVSFDSHGNLATNSLSNADTTADFCQNLRLANIPPVTASQPRVGTIGLGGYAVAYALAYPGRSIADSAGSIFDGLNAGGMGTVASNGPPAMELPQAGSVIGSYNDRVIARTYSGLGSALGCDRLIASINSISLAYDVIDEVRQLKTTNTESAAILVTIGGIKAIVGGIAIRSGVILLGTAIVYEAEAGVQLGIDIAACFILVGCALIPVMAFAVVASALAIVANGVAIGLNVAAVVATVTSMTLAGIAASQAGAPAGTSTVNLFDFTTSTASANSSLQAANQAVTDANTALVLAKNNADAAQTTSDTKETDLKSAAHGLVAANDAKNMDTPLTTLASAYDANFDTVRANATALWAAQQNVVTAQNALNQTVSASDASVQAAQLSAEQATISNQIVAANGQITALNAQINTLNAQSPSDSAGQILLSTQLATDNIEHDGLVAQNASLATQLAGLSPDLASAQANLNAATLGATNAANALATAMTNAEAPFLMTYNQCHDSSSNPSTRICVAQTQDNRPVIKAAIEAQYSSTSPQGPYFTYLTNQATWVAAQANYTSAQQNQVQTQLAYNNLVSLNAVTSISANIPIVPSVPVGLTGLSDPLDILKKVDKTGGIQ